MRIARTVAEVRVARAQLPEQLGFVPTMGALHAGHLELVRRARDENQAVAVSIFVNPTQFTSVDDFRKYPRDDERDLALLAESGVDIVFLPTTETLYPVGFGTTIDVGLVAVPFEGIARPGHFGGVATVVAMLFNAVQPARAYFGEKDAQQLRVVRQLVTDLLMPIEIVAVPTVRDEDGFALSSRNTLLTLDQRAAAAAIPRALVAVQRSWDAGERDAERLRQRLSDELALEPTLSIEYASLADPETLVEHEGQIEGAALVLISVRLGAVRLIDNCLLSLPLDCR
ncbi:MAG TPA: pantoate--beta-alanine ligase [Thermomicrobiales bacterium]|nr:pantoate--beta-alanine ligase [Thermomicrobiales bacterium]